MKKRLLMFVACLLTVLIASVTVLPVVAPNMTSAQAVSLTLKKGKTTNVKTKVRNAWDAWACNKYNGDCLLLSLTFRSSNRSVATIDNSGKVTAKGKGSCKLYAVAEYRVPVGMKSNGDVQYSSKIYYKEVSASCKVN